jgi:hypothetical protein
MQESPQPVVYLPLSQSEQGYTIFVVRSYRVQNEMTAAIERALRGLEPNAPITVQSWLEVLGGQNALFPARTAVVALGVMGLLAAMLAVTGIFGMAAYNVSRRMKELGIRVALGARTRHVMSAAVGRPILLLGLGSLVGLLSSIFAGADCVSGESARSGGRDRRGANDGAAGHCSVHNSSPASACRRSLQTFAGRVKQANALHVSDHLGRCR